MGQRIFKKLDLGHDLMEHQYYRDESFPVEVYEDDFDEFPDRTLPCHWHLTVEFDLMTAGNADYIVDGIPHTLRCGDVILVLPGHMHMAKPETPDRRTQAIGMTFDPTMFAASPGTLFYHRFFAAAGSAETGAAAFSAGSAAGRELRACLRRIHAVSADAPCFELQCMEEILHMWRLSGAAMVQDGMQDGEGKNTARMKELKSMLSFISGHYQEKITVDDLRRSASVSRSSCFRNFRYYTGMNPNEYLNDYRLRRSALLLCSGSAEVTEVAGSCGFVSPSYFSSVFRKKYGMTPREYRDKNMVQESMG
ncbi:MAG: AraC family transcriptional regulator [Lachnospiraceae bacterium]|jgi:AraC-like DNA-binding protein|nr:AraC family transcriptional regulator [Lachnospiraceae bacterium]